MSCRKIRSNSSDRIFFSTFRTSERRSAQLRPLGDIPVEVPVDVPAVVPESRPFSIFRSKNQRVTIPAAATGSSRAVATDVFTFVEPALNVDDAHRSVSRFKDYDNSFVFSIDRKPVERRVHSYHVSLILFFPPSAARTFRRLFFIVRSRPKGGGGRSFRTDRRCPFS